MPLPEGTRFGVFEVVTLIGAGGMGEVYRARDTRLERDVALKVLPGEFTNDRDRFRRFEREAKTLASLNHPHIAHVYGLEDASPGSASESSACALAMELIPGEDLAERLARGPIPMAGAIAIARQIADAIGFAHDRGIIHRDLKPSNVKVTPDGTVKVLDFGLAKAVEADVADSTAAATTRAGTLQGTILGTPAYMSPEQLRGHALDARSDVWAFGCVLYEMLAGRQAFAGATTSDVIARIIEREPDWAALPPATPTSVQRLLARCLEKDPQRRLHALADAHFDLDEALHKSGSRVASRTRILRPRTFVSAALVAAALLVVPIWRFLNPPAASLQPRLMPLTSYPGVEARPTFSPDGRQIAFSWDGEKQDNEDIYVVVVGSDLPLRATKDPARDVSPAWGPDGSQIAFARLQGDRASIHVVSPLGQSEQKLAEFSALPVLGPRDLNDPLLSWSPDGRWLTVSHVTSRGEKGIFLLARDGSAQRLLIPGQAADTHAAMAFSPRGDMLAYVESGYISLAEIDATDPPAVSKPPRKVTSYQGFIGGLTWTADARELIFGRALYAAPTPSYLWRVSVSGDRPPERIDLAGVGSFPVHSASQHRLAYSRREINVDMMKLQTGREPETVAASTFNEFDASFSPDGTKVAFASDRLAESNEIWIANVDGSGRRRLTHGTNKPEGSPRWSPDGKRLAYDGLGDDAERHVYVIDEAGGPPKVLSFKRGFYDQVPSWSRDGKWIYFGSNRSGRDEIWRSPADGGDAKQMTRTGGVGFPCESWDGRTLYYSRPISGGRTIYAMPVGGGSERRLDVNVVFWNYLPGERGLYFTSLVAGSKPPYTYEVRLFDQSGKTHVLQSVRLASMSPGLSVLQDGKTVLIAGVAQVGQDLLRIENFR